MKPELNCISWPYSRSAMRSTSWAFKPQTDEVCFLWMDFLNWLYDWFKLILELFNTLAFRKKFLMILWFYVLKIRFWQFWLWVIFSNSTLNYKVFFIDTVSKWRQTMSHHIQVGIPNLPLDTWWRTQNGGHKSWHDLCPLLLHICSLKSCEGVEQRSVKTQRKNPWERAVERAWVCRVELRRVFSPPLCLYCFLDWLIQTSSSVE